MGTRRKWLLAFGPVLLTFPLFCASAQTSSVETSIPGNRGQIIRPVVPGPPTYTDPLAEPENRRDTLFEAKPRADPTCQYERAGYVRGTGEPPLDLPALYSGWLASDLIGRPVYSGGEQVGAVQDIIVGPGGNINALSVQQGGLGPFGEQLFRVGWNELRAGRDGVVLHNAEALSATKYEQSVPVGAGEYRVSNVRGDWTRIPIEGCSLRHGELNDVVFDPAGNILAIVEKRATALGGGNFAYPFADYSQGWRRLYGMFDLPQPGSSKPGAAVQRDRFASFIESADAARHASPPRDARGGR